VQIRIVSDAQITDWKLPAVITNASGSANVTTAVVEGSANGTPLFTASATPKVSGANVTYAFTSDGNPDSVAAMNILNGTATLVGTLDYESKATYIFKVM